MTNFTVDITPPKATKPNVNLEVSEASDRHTLSIGENRPESDYEHTLKQVKTGFDTLHVPAHSSIKIVLDGKSIQTIPGDLYNKATKLMGYEQGGEQPSLLAEYADHILKRRPAPAEKFQDFVASEMKGILDLSRERVREGNKEYASTVRQYEAATKEWNKSILVPSGSNVETVSQRIKIEDHILAGLKDCSPVSLHSATGHPLQDSQLLNTAIQKSCPAPQKNR